MQSKRHPVSLNFFPACCVYQTQRGKTVAEYATDHGIDVKAMYAGKKALVKKGVLARTRVPRFQQAQVVGPVVAGEWHIGGVYGSSGGY